MHKQIREVSDIAQNLYTQQIETSPKCNMPQELDDILCEKYKGSNIKLIYR